MINLTPEQKEVLESRIIAAKRWGFSKAFLWLNEDDPKARIEHWAVYGLDGRLLRTFRRVKVEEFANGGNPVRVN